MNKKNKGDFRNNSEILSKKHILFMSALFFVIYAFIENKFMLCTRREYFGNGVKIAHISDVHKRNFGRNNSRICSKIRRESPDIIFITGDVVSRNETDFSAVESMLKELCGISPVYMIFGNHEQTLPTEMKKKFIETIDRTGAMLLRNKSAYIETNGHKLHIYGLEDRKTVYKNGKSYRNLDKITLADMNNLLGKCPDGEKTILLAHNPFFCGVYSQWGAEYTLSGHVHGGIVRILGKGLLSPERKLFPSFSKGVYTSGRMKLLVSGGLGKLRLFNPPEIVIYRI
ncbi:MAG: metallophosphoesterase [Ruminococcus sp.]|nr:metallophosphoesterase [Ruminococcus sp.]